MPIACEWGARGAILLAPRSDAVIVVDVLSFTTAVDIAVARGATILQAPRPGAVLAGQRGTPGAWSLSPASLESIPPGTALALPSPNGGAISLLTGDTRTFAACLRNARAVALAAIECGPRIAVIPAGEQWPDGSLRPSVEDLIGAGAVIAHLAGSRSAEAEAAVAVFERFRGNFQEAFTASVSGQELIERGFRRDIELAAEYDVSDVVPVLAGDRFVDARSRQNPSHT